jgi:kynurenine 3-monooxygenase
MQRMAIVPFYGQGMNAGFEDCRILNDLLNLHNDDWDIVLT